MNFFKRFKGKNKIFLKKNWPEHKKYGLFEVKENLVLQRAQRGRGIL